MEEIEQNASRSIPKLIFGEGCETYRYLAVSSSRPGPLEKVDAKIDAGKVVNINEESMPELIYLWILFANIVH